MRRLTGPLCGPAPPGSNDQIPDDSCHRARRPVAAIRRPSSTAPEAHGSRRSAPPKSSSAPSAAPGSRRNVPRPAAAVGRHPRGLRRAPRVGADALRRALRRRVVARGVRRPRREPLGVADLRGGVLPGRRAAAGHAERHLPARADDLRVRHARAAGPHPAARWRRASRPGARAGRSRTRAATSPASRAEAVRDDAARRLAALAARRRGRRAARSARTSSGCSAATRRAERHQRPHLLPRRPRRRRASPCAASNARRRRGLRRGVPRRRVRRPTPTCSASRTRAGASRWRRPARSAGSRCARPGRFLATARPAHRARTATRADDDPRRCATGSSTAWIDAEAYRWQTFWTVTRIVEGAARRARSRASSRSSGRSSTSRLHELALELLGRPRRAASTATIAALDEGLPVRARRARSTRARTRSSAT